MSNAVAAFEDRLAILARHLENLDQGALLKDKEAMLGISSCTELLQQHQANIMQLTETRYKMQLLSSAAPLLGYFVCWL